MTIDVKTNEELEQMNSDEIRQELKELSTVWNFYNRVLLKFIEKKDTEETRARYVRENIT